MREPSRNSRNIAFGILQRHGDLLQDDVSLNDLIDDIAAAIDRPGAVVEAAERWRRAHHHGTREEQDLQEHCLLDAVDALR